VKGVVLETYRTGEFPLDELFINSIREAVKNGVIFVNVSQTPKLNGLNYMGVFDGYDMTTEAALAKMYFLISNSDMPMTLMSLPMRGEITKVENSVQDTKQTNSEPLNGITDLGDII
jgi:L-asparaginase